MNATNDMSDPATKAIANYIKGATKMIDADLGLEKYNVRIDYVSDDKDVIKMRFKFNDEDGLIQFILEWC